MSWAGDSEQLTRPLKTTSTVWSDSVRKLPSSVCSLEKIFARGIKRELVEGHTAISRVSCQDPGSFEKGQHLLDMLELCLAA